MIISGYETTSTAQGAIAFTEKQNFERSTVNSKRQSIQSYTPPYHSFKWSRCAKKPVRRWVIFLRAQAGIESPTPDYPYFSQ